MKAWMSSNFGKFATELLPLDRIQANFVYTLSLTRSLSGF